MREHGAAPVPAWLRSGPAPGPGAAAATRTPTAARATSAPQELLPERVAGERFYEPDEAEAELAERLRARSAGPAAVSGDNRRRDERRRAASGAAPASSIARRPGDRRGCSARVAADGARADVDEVVQATSPRSQPLWALLRVKDRARYMRRMAQAVIDDFDELAGGARPRAGPPARRDRGARAARGDRRADLDRRGRRRRARRRGASGSAARCRPPSAARIAYEPYGVVGVIGAGSAPFAQPLGQIAGALLAGNGVVFKPAARACLAGERIARVLARAGPAGGARADRPRRRRGRRRARRSRRSTRSCSPARPRSGAWWRGHASRARRR